jgi:hypothetical protein
MNTTPGPYATTREDGVVVIADDADWTVPGIHNRYRAALQSALTRHVWNWQDWQADGGGDGGLVSRFGCWSPRYVWLRQGVVAVSSKEDPDCMTEFAIRESEIEALDTRVEQIRRALEGLADNTATEINGGGEPVRSDEYGDVKLDSGEVIPGDGTCPSHLSDKNWPRDLRALSEEKSFLEDLVNLIPGPALRAEAMRASTAALAGYLTETYREYCCRGLTATEEIVIRESPLAGYEPWEIELAGIRELDDEAVTLVMRDVMRDRVEALGKHCTPRLTTTEVRLYEGILNLAFPLVEQALAVCEVDVLRHHDGVWELARRMVEPGELLGELDGLTMAQVMPVLAQKIIYRALGLGVIDRYPSGPCEGDA